MSSINMAKSHGDMAPPCLTPETSLKKLDTWAPHLIHVQDKSNQFSIISSKFIGSCLFINFISKAWWFILSNAFERSSAQRLTVEPPAIYPSITVLMEYIALEQLSPFLKPNWLSPVVKKDAYRSTKQCSYIFWQHRADRYTPKVLHCQRFSDLHGRPSVQERCNCDRMRPVNS